MGEEERIVWSVVIPACDEAPRLPAYLREESYEVIVVNGGSRDATCDRVRELQAFHDRIWLIALPENHGKGYAVRVGMVNARGAFRLFADADGATPIGELMRLEPALQAGADIVIGSRVRADPAVSVHARKPRVHAGRVFNWLMARLGLRGIGDSQYGFKCFRGLVAEALFRVLRTELRTDGFGFDVERLLLAQQRGYTIAEVAVDWTDRPGSKVRVLTDGPRMLWQILSARVALALGHQER